MPNQLFQINKYCLLFLYFACLLTFSNTEAEEIQFPHNNQALNHIINTQVVETYDFAGMALYLNQVSFFSDNGESLQKIDDENFVAESGHIEKLIVAGRFKALVIDLGINNVQINNNQLIIDEFSSAVKGIKLYNKKSLAQLNPEYQSIRYHHLWWPLAQLSIFFEMVLVLLGGLVYQHWGLAILLFAVLIKTIFIPLSIATNKVQNKVSDIQVVLLPELSAIKAKYDGEEAHVRIMDAHKKLGVSPFFSLKPLLMTLIQIPFLIAIFNTLGEMPELKGARFLWIDDLSLPDMLFNLGHRIPMFGEWFNVLPFIMAGITLLATINYGDKQLPERTLKNQRIRLYLMTLVFFVLFYPFPAAMVYYWSLVNLWQLIQQHFKTQIHKK